MTKTIGVLGGMGPAATATFFTRLTALTPATKDQDHPRVVILSDPTVPDRTTQILSGEDAITDQLRANCEQLIEMGADVLACPCNTAHHFLANFADELSVPLVSIIDAEINAALEATGEDNRAWLTCTTGTRETRLYQNAAEKAGLDLAIPSDADFERLMDIIDAIKAGDMSLAGQIAEEVYGSLGEREDLPFLTACTELPLAYAVSSLDKSKEVSSIDSLVKDVLRTIGVTPLDR